MRAVSVILSLFSILITLSYQTAGADLPCTRTVQGLPEEEKAEVVKQLGNLPAFFIENQGQVAEEARYYFKGSDTVYFTGEAVVFQKTGDRGQGVGDRERFYPPLEKGGRGDLTPFEKGGPETTRDQGVEDREDSEIRNPNSELGKLGPRENNVACESCPRQIRLGGLASHAEGFNVPDELARYSFSYKLEFVGANATSPQARNELEGRVNYLIGNDPSGWHTNVPTYQEIVYPGLYGGPESVPARHSERSEESSSEESRPFAIAQGDTNGLIDLVYKGVPGGMKYEFVVHPGASPDDIKLAYNGIEGLSIDDSGNLIIHTALGDVKDERPYTYQEIDGKEVEVTAGFRLISSPSPSLPPTPYPLPPSYGFEVASYDENYPLVIDPGLSYSTYLGGSNINYGNGIALDASGNAFVTGYTYSSNFPTTPGAYDTSYNGNSDAFVTKLNSAGSGLVYSTFLGGSSGDYGYGIAVDASGNAYVTGQTYSSDFPTTTGAYDTSYNGGGDAFATKLNPAGSALVYSTFLGGSSGDYGYGIAVDASGNAYGTGYTYSTNFPTTPGAFDTSHNGSGWDAVVIKLNPAGSALSYVTYLGGSSFDIGYGIAVDASGNAYVTGQTYSSDFPTTTGAYDTSYNGGGDAFATKLNPTGSALVYSTFLGGSGYDIGYGIAVDASGNAYGTGYTLSSNFPATPGAFDTSFNGYDDAFVTKLDFSAPPPPPVPGTLLWQNYYNREGSLSDRANAVAVSTDRVFVAGWTQTAAGGFAFSTRAYNVTNGALSWQNQYGREGGRPDWANAVAFSSGRVFAAGVTTTVAGGNAFSVRAYNATNGALLWQNYYNREGSLSDVANALAVNGAGDRVFVAGCTATTAGGQAFAIRAYNATNGTLLWENHYNRSGSLSDVANAVSVGKNAVFVAGQTSTAAGGSAFSVRAYNATTGALLWQNHYNREGALGDVAKAVVVNGAGDKVFVAGYTTTAAGGLAFAVRAYNATNGTLLWQNYYNREGSRIDLANAVSVSGDRVFVAGYTTTLAGGNAFAVRAYNATNGTLLWQNHYNREGNRSDVANAVTVDSSSNKVFVAGYTSTTAGGKVFSVRAYNATSGAVLWQKFYNMQGALADEANAVAVGGDRVFAAGYTTTTAGGSAFSVITHQQ